MTLEPQPSTWGGEPHLRCWAAQDDRVVEVIAAHERCMVVLSDRHIAVLTNKRMSLKSGPRPGWSVPLSEIQNVRGEGP